MATPIWMRLAFRLASEITAALSGETVDGCYLTNPNYQTLPYEEQSFSDQLLTSIASILGIGVAQPMTLFRELPIATTLLLKLTETIPSEILLFLIVVGALGCVGFAVFLALVLPLVVAYLCSKGATTTRHAIRFAFNRCRRTPNDTPVLQSSFTPSPLSDAARHIEPTVNANNVVVHQRDSRRRTRNSRT